MSRPVSLTVAVVLQWVAAVITLLAGLDLVVSAIRLSDAAAETAIDNATKLQGITDVSSHQVVAGVLMAGGFLLAIALLRVVLAVYLARGRSWARTVITVLVVLNMLGAVAYLFQEEFWRAVPALIVEVVVLWLLYNAQSSRFVAERSAS